MLVSGDLEPREVNTVSVTKNGLLGTRGEEIVYDSQGQVPGTRV